MEANIQSVLSQTEEVNGEVGGSDDVKGVLAADHRGLCIAAQGECKPRLAGAATNLAVIAGQIEPEEDHPVILIEAGTRKYLIKREEKTTIVIAKTL